MTSAAFDIEVRAFDRATGARLPLNPKVVLAGVTWSYVERGGAEMATVPIKVSFEQIPVANGDYIEIWAINSGETVPRWRGICNVPERSLAVTEKHTITAYGRMEDMAHVVVDKLICHPNSMSVTAAGSTLNTGADLSIYAHDILADYLSRISQSTAPYQPIISASINDTGINIQTLDATLTTARSAMDAIADQGGTNTVWGWGINGVDGTDEFYFCPRSESVIGNQFFVGVGVAEVTAPMEYQALSNTAWVKGGPALYPNLLTNPSFEVPIVPDGQDGNLLTDGSFEAEGASGGENPPFPNPTNFMGDWTGKSGATLAYHYPDHNWNFSAHTGQYCVTLGYTNAEIYQDVDITHGTPYVASLFAAREDGAFASAGSLVIEGRTSSGHVVDSETKTLNFSPPSVAWTGGQATTVIGSSSIQLPVVFQDSSVVKARIRVIATNQGSSTQNLLIDDVLFAPVGGVGTLGWGTHVENVGSGNNQVIAVDWANTSTVPWDGYYCARIQTHADPGNRVYIAPLPEPGTSGGAEFATGGYQMHPTPGMDLRVGVRVRMSPGVASGDHGTVNVEYRSHAGDGHENHFQAGPATPIPNDGNWYWIYIDVSVNGDTAIAVAQLSFQSSDWYDVDGWSARDVAAAEGGSAASGHIALDPSTSGYLRGTKFEAVLDVENPKVQSAGLLPALQTSIEMYGRREAVVSNDNIVALTGQCYSWAAAWLNQNAMLLGRTRVLLADEQVQRPDPAALPPPDSATHKPLPAAASLIRVSGTGNDIPDQFATKTTYTWTGRLGVSIELTTQRPTLDKMLLSAALATASGGTSSTGSALAASSSGPPSSGGAAQAPVLIVDTFSPSGSTNVFTLTQTPSYSGLICYQQPDGLKIAQSAITSVNGTMLTLNYDPAAGTNTLEVCYFYVPVTDTEP